jgi:hypothetical protein
VELLTSVKKQIEDARFRVQLLKQEKLRKENHVKVRHVISEKEKELIDDLGKGKIYYVTLPDLTFSFSNFFFLSHAVYDSFLCGID